MLHIYIYPYPLKQIFYVYIYIEHGICFSTAHLCGDVSHASAQ